MPSPRRGRKSRRHNGFSLENFAVQDDETSGRIQIFTDSRDNVPQEDTTESNPFIDHHNEPGPATRRLAGTAKRRKVSGETKKDPQVGEAIDRDEGMVYIL